MSLWRGIGGGPAKADVKRQDLPKFDGIRCGERLSGL